MLWTLIDLPDIDCVCYPYLCEPHTITTTLTCSQTLSLPFTPTDLLLLSLSVCKSLHNLQSTWKSKFFLLWSNYHAAWTQEWIFKSNTLLLTRTCPLWCPADGYMWYTKPSLSASSTSPGWKATWEDAELHALSIHYPVVVMLQQLLEQKATKISCNVCKHGLLPVHHEWGLLMKKFQIPASMDH